MNKKRIAFIVLVVLSLTGTTFFVASSIIRPDSQMSSGAGEEEQPKGCVFKTVFGEENVDSHFIYKTPQKVMTSVDRALEWMAKAQMDNGGWGAGSHNSQRVMDPHAVKADPATTAMVSMALLRCGHTPLSGKYSTHLNKGMYFLLAAVEASPENDANITAEKNTQPQTKLGSNIDVVLTSQFLTNVLDYLEHDAQLKQRVMKCIDKCVAKIQQLQAVDGSMKGDGWAGVLQSSFAGNALEMAQTKGARVDTAALNKSREYQKGNYDVNTGDIGTEKGAGVMLYSISGTGRSSAKESRYAKEKINEAKEKGLLEDHEDVSVENLKKAGLNDADAMKYRTAFEINEAAKELSQDEKVMDGFGSNGGEEFMSYLQTGEGLIINKDTTWKGWYGNVSGKLLHIQNNNGSWSGHHCITSPVFCTATCLLILSVNNDVEELLVLGKQ